MADVQHSTLSGAEVHEPKDIATGTDGQVYTANGIGSGTWADQTGRDTNALVHVRSASDFPAPIVGVITLAADTTYLIDGLISVGADRLVLSNNTGLVGHNGLVDELLYTGNTIFLTSTANFLIDSVRLNCTDVASTLFAVSGTGVETAVITRVASLACGSLGTFTSRGVTAMTTVAVVSTVTAGFVFTGVHGKLSILDGFFLGWVGTLFDLNGATFNNIIFSSGNQFDVSVGTTAIDGLAAGGNILAGGAGIIAGNVFSGLGTFLSGISTKDVAWSSINNSGLSDSHVVGVNFLSGGPTNTVLATGVPTKIAGTTVLAPDTERVDDEGGTDNRLRYIGIDTETVLITGTVTGQSAGGSSITCDMIIKAFPSGSENTIVSGIQFPTATDATYTFQFPAELETDDSIELWVNRTSGSQDLQTAFLQLSFLKA